MDSAKHPPNKAAREFVTVSIRKRIKGIGGMAVVAVVVALLTVSVSSRVLPGSNQQLISGSDFAITSKITASPACSGAEAKLYPGLVRCITYTVSNPKEVPITVGTIGISVANPEPAGCAASNLDLSQAGFTGSLVVPAKVGAVNGTSSVSRTISLKNVNGSQDGCKNAVFSFAYTGTAQYTLTTTTGVATSGSPAIVGQVVTYTATVTPSSTPPSTPTGSVTFKDGTSAISCASGSQAFNGTTATCKVTYASTVGSPHPITATFNPADSTNFTGSTSSPLSQSINGIPTSSSLLSSVNPTVSGQSVTFTDTVTASTGTAVPTGNVTFYDGSTPLGTTSLNASAKATLTTTALSVGTHQITAVYAGSTVHATSTSNAVSQTVYSYCISDKQNTAPTISSGQSVCITSTGDVKGPITIQNGGTLSILGGTVGNGTGNNGNNGNDKGNITVQNGGTLIVQGGTILGSITSTGAKGITICGAQVTGMTISGSTGAVLVGNPTSCAANAIKATATFTGNAAAVTVGGNTITGNLACSGNTSTITNASKPNTVSGSRTGQCAGF